MMSSPVSLKADMGWEYPSDLIWKAQELYCVDRQSYAAVAGATGVSATTLKAWGQRYGWAQKREELAQAESEIRVNIIKGRQKALEQLLASAGPKEAAQMAFAVTSLESLALKRMELAASGKIPDAKPTARCKAGSRAEAVAALRDAVERKLGAALADPDKITTQTVTDIKRCLELVGELEAALPKTDAAETEKKHGLSGDMVDSIYKVLGAKGDADE